MKTLSSLCIATAVASFLLTGAVSAQTQTAPAPAAKSAKLAKPAAKPAPIGAAKLIGQVQAAYGDGKTGAAKSGFKLDMASGGPDHHDAQFERAS